jgi:hypothetical protein
MKAGVASEPADAVSGQQPCTGLISNSTRRCSRRTCSLSGVPRAIAVSWKAPFWVVIG